MDAKRIMKYLKLLMANNNREWYQSHKDVRRFRAMAMFLRAKSFKPAKVVRCFSSSRSCPSNSFAIYYIVTDALIYASAWAGIEIKLGSQNLIDEGARNLLKLADDIGEGLPKPSFLMVLTATQNAYRRDDGVWVVPLGNLRN